MDPSSRHDRDCADFVIVMSANVWALFIISSKTFSPTGAHPASGCESGAGIGNILRQEEVDAMMMESSHDMTVLLCYGQYRVGCAAVLVVKRIHMLESQR